MPPQVDDENDSLDFVNHEEVQVYQSQRFMQRLIFTAVLMINLTLAD